MNFHFTFLEGDDLHAAIDRSWEEWHHEKERGAFEQFLRAMKETPWGRAHWRTPALRADRPRGEIVATMFVYDFTMAVENARARVAGIGSFGVRRELRGRGVGSRLLDEVHKLLRDEGYDAALLYSGIGKGYYEKFGYTALPTLQIEARTEGWREAGPAASALSRARPYEPGDFPAVRNLYNTHVSAQRMGVLRSDDYWDFDVMRERLLVEMFAKEPYPWSFLVGERDGRAVSYLRTRRVGDALLVLEYGFETGAKDDVAAMLRFLLERLDGISAIRGKVPSRFVNLCPARHFAWTEEDKRIVLMRPIKDAFSIPSFGHSDEYFHWTIDLL